MARTLIAPTTTTTNAKIRLKACSKFALHLPQTVVGGKSSRQMHCLLHANWSVAYIVVVGVTFYFFCKKVTTSCDNYFGILYIILTTFFVAVEVASEKSNKGKVR